MANSAADSKQSLPKIQLKNIDKVYHSANGPFQALTNINLTVQKGEVYGIIGRSGAGKSTLIRLINLLERPSKGQVILDGQDITNLHNKDLIQLRQKIGMVFQHFNLLSSKTVLDNVILPLKIAGVPKAQRLQRAKELIDLVGLSAHLHKYPCQLSGGQKQRIGIARSLANNPEILLCDEATSALDPETTQSILALLKDISRKMSLTVVLITHSMDVIRNICDQVAVIEAGKLIEQGSVIDVFLHPQQDTTKKLLAETSLSQSSWEILRDNIDGHVIQITYKGVQAARPIISHISLETGIEVNILQGNVGYIGEESYGQLIVSLACDQATYQKILELLNSQNIRYDVLK